MIAQLQHIHQVACIGEAMIELRFGAGNTASVGYSGDSLNTAVYLKRMWPDGDISYVTALGVEHASDRILAFIQAENLNTGHVVRLPGHNAGLYAISTDRDGERSFTYWRENSAARQLFSPLCNLDLDSLAGHGLIYLSAISLAILPDKDRDKLHEFLVRYRGAGGIVAFDSNYRPQLWGDRDVARRIIRRMWQITDLGLPSLDDETAIFGDANESAVLARLARWGVRYGALKRGLTGPRSLADDCAEMDFAPAKVVKDTTAAGDSFNAGFIATALRAGSIRECLEAGHELACQVIGHEGAIVPVGV